MVPFVVIFTFVVFVCLFIMYLFSALWWLSRNWCLSN